jgi:hypothetical protein
LNAKLWPFKPDAITASRIELGPTSGFTRTPRRCASRTRFAPGSATAGTPASDISPASWPATTGASSASSSDSGVLTFSSRIVISCSGRASGVVSANFFSSARAVLACSATK